MNYLQKKKSIFQTHFILLKNFNVRKEFSDIKHVNLYKEMKYFIEAIIFKKKITIKSYEYTVQHFFNISNDEVAQLKTINLQFINKIINQDTYSKSIKFIQNNSTEIKKLEDIIIHIFPNVFKRLSS